MSEVQPLSAAPQRALRFEWQRAGWVLLALLGVLLWIPSGRMLADLWRTDETLSHGPLVLLIAGGLLWSRRSELRSWDAACLPGLLLMVLAGLVQLASVWADLQFLKPLSLLGMAAGAVWFLGGWRAVSVVAGPLGLLAFTIPWPTTIVERIAFPLQITSSAYAALFGGILGLPIVREGVHLAVMPDLNAAPVYTVLVARQCSGLSSLMVLLALGYLIAYHTSVGIGWRALLVALVVPVAIFNNAVRLTLILMAGAYHGAGLAKWVHDNEAPVLVFLCTLGLMGFRAALLAWLESRKNAEVPSAEPLPIIGS